MAGNAVVCLVCGFNRVTGKRLKTVSRRLAGRWDSENIPLFARLIAFAVILAVCCLPLLGLPEDEPETQLAVMLIPVGAALLGALALGTFRRVTVTSDMQGIPVLIQQMWICFIPMRPWTTDLTEYRTIRLTHREDRISGMTLLLLVILCVFGGLIALLLRFRLLRNDLFTLEIISECDRDGAPFLEPLRVYRGRSQRMARGIGDDLEGIAGLHYG